MPYAQNLSTEAEAHFSALRRENKRVSDHYLSTLHSNENYLSAFNRYNSAKFDLSKAKYVGDENGIKDAEKIIEECKAEMNSIMKQMNIEKDWLRPQYSCNLCKDTGKLPNGKKCVCYKNFIKDLIFERLGITEKVYPDYSSSAALKDNNLDVIYGKTSGYIEKFPSGAKSPFVISGSVGVGKSHLAYAIAGKISEKGYNVITLTAYELHSIFTKYASAPFSERDSYLEILMDCDLLVIDDLGCEPIINNVSNQCLYAILSERAVNGSPIIITTNLDHIQLSERYGECLFSRIFDRRSGVEIQLSGEDLRIKK